MTTLNLARVRRDRRPVRQIALAFAVLLPATAAVAASGATSNAATATLYAYVANGPDHTVSVVDVTTSQTVTTIPVAAYPGAVAASANGSRVYVADQTSTPPIVQIIDTKTNTVTGSVGVGSEPDAIVLSPDGSVVYVVNQYDDTVSVISTSTQQVVKTFTVTGIGGTGAYFADNAAVSPNGKKLYVTISTGYVAVFDTATGKDQKNLVVGDHPDGVVVSPDGTKLYVTDLPGSVGSLTAVNASTGAVLGQITLGPEPEGIVLSPDGTTAYVVDGQVNMLSIIDTATVTLTKTKALDSGAQTIVYDNSTSQLFIPQFGANSVGIVQLPADITENVLPVGTHPTSVALVSRG